MGMFIANFCSQLKIQIVQLKWLTMRGRTKITKISYKLLTIVLIAGVCYHKRNTIALHRIVAHKEPVLLSLKLR